MAAKRKETLSRKEWEVVRDLFARCAPLTPSDREALLAAETAGTPRLRKEVESLLAHGQVSDDFLGRPVLNRLAGAPPIPAAPTDPAASQVGKYRLLQRLGRGGTAEVFLANMTGPGAFDRLVAVKRFLPGLHEDPSQRQAFEEEARIGSRLNHPNIVHLYDFFEANGTYYLAMELVTGVTLGALAHRAKAAGVGITPEIGAMITSQIASALDYAHRFTDELTGQSLGLVHRDISPKNILISFQGEVKIVDFGITKTRDRVARTATGFLRGTLGYLSPEAASGQPVDGWSDLYAACLLLYELLRGAPLFSGEDPFALLREVQRGSLPRKRLADLAAPDKLKAVLAKGLSRSPDDRFPTGEALRAALAPCVGGVDSTGPIRGLSALVEPLFAEERAQHRRWIEDSRQFRIADASTSRTKTSPLPRLRLAWPGWAPYLIIALLLAVVASLVFLPRKAARKVPTAGPCQRDADRLCPGRVVGGGLFMCLRREMEKVTPDCRTYLQDLPVPKDLPQKP